MASAGAGAPSPGPWMAGDWSGLVCFQVEGMAALADPADVGVSPALARRTPCGVWVFTRLFLLEGDPRGSPIAIRWRGSASAGPPAVRGAGSLIDVACDPSLFSGSQGFRAADLRISGGAS